MYYIMCTIQSMKQKNNVPNKKCFIPVVKSWFSLMCIMVLNHDISVTLYWLVKWITPILRWICLKGYDTKTSHDMQWKQLGLSEWTIYLEAFRRNFCNFTRIVQLLVTAVKCKEKLNQWMHWLYSVWF